MIIIYIVLAISIGLNLLFIFYDILPYIIPGIKRKFMKSKKKYRGVNQLENIIIEASMSQIKNKDSKMPWNIGGVYNLIKSINRKRVNDKEFRNFNYPRGYLLYGLTEYLINQDDSSNLLELKNIFDKYYITKNGSFLFDFNKVDQVTFGLSALNLYKIYEEEKYKVLSDKIYSFIHQKYLKDKLVTYRDNLNCELNDTIGMVVPFLVKYYQMFSNPDALNIANNQMVHFIKFGVDKETFLPSHGFNFKAKTKTGSSNWGRGIGWYFIGLKYFFDLNESFKSEYEGLCLTLRKLKNEEGLWGQFPGSSNYFDASTSTMFIYCLPQNEFKIEEIFNKLDKYITRKGYITETTGDTEGLNFYSKFSGLSELSQGMLLLILSRYK